MPSSTSGSQIGRQLWASVRDSVDALVWGIAKSPQPQSFNRLGFAARARLSSSSHTPSFPSAGRPFHHSSRPLPRQSARFAPTNVRRSCTSGSLLLLGLSSPIPSTQTVVTSCTAAADSALTTNGASKSSISRLARQGWRRSIHTGPQESASGQGAQRKSVNPATDEEKRASAAPKTEAPVAPAEGPKPDPMAAHHGPESLSDSVSKYLQLPHLPKMPHRPTKEELLAAANGFWQRLKVRFKWLSIRSMRPYNADEWGAFVSWFMLGHLVWILVGTTTFFSLIIFMVNTVFAQETLAKWIGDYLTQSAGVTVVFESAIVPKWKDGVITFRNVFVSRRPGQIKSSVKKGSSSNAAAVAAARHVHPDGQSVVPIAEEEEGNYTQFDVTINTVNVTLSFLKWWNGTGLLRDVEVKGVRGVLDRTSVRWSPDQADPHSYKHVHQPGDFEIEHFRLEDLLVTVHQPDGFRPFPVSIYSCELPQLRKQWLFHDFLYASHMSGSFDGSLFTIHPRQIHGVAAGAHGDHAGDGLGEPGAWKKFSRLRIDGLKIDHLNRGVEGPFGWIYEGNVDIVADLMFPADEDDSLGKVMSDFYEKMEEAVSRNRYVRILDKELRGGLHGSRERGRERDRQRGRKAVTSSILNDEVKGHVSDYTMTSSISDVSSSSSWSVVSTEGDLQQSQSSITGPPPSSPPDSPSSVSLTPVPEPETEPEPEPEPAPEAKHNSSPPRYLVMDLRIHLNDVRAAVPLFTHDISYISQPLVRPIVAYINAKRTYIPISCRLVKRVSDLDGSWTVYDCGMMDDLGAEVYAAFARDVEDQHSRVRRLKKVGFWTLSMVVHALLAGVAGDLI